MRVRMIIALAAAAAGLSAAEFSEPPRGFDSLDGLWVAGAVAAGPASIESNAVAPSWSMYAARSHRPMVLLPQDQHDHPFRGRHFFWDNGRWQEAEYDGQVIGFFAQCGWSPGDRRESAYCEGGGVKLFGLIPARDADAFGFGYVRVEYGDVPRRLRDWASAIETFYSVQLCDWLRLTPDVQVIVRPSGFGRDTVLFGMRVSVAL